MSQIMKTKAPRQYRLSAIPLAEPKKRTSKEVKHLQECQEQTMKLVSDPELYYKFHNDYELMLYLTQMLTKVTLDMGNVAHVVFNDKNAAFKDLVKASNAYIDSLKACNKAVEAIRTDRMLFANPNTDEGDDQYDQSFKDSLQLLRINRLALEILDASNREGFTQIESALKLIYKPNMDRQNRLVIAQGVLDKHKADFGPEATERWRKYIYAQTEEGAKALREKKTRHTSNEQKEWAEFLSDNEKR